MKTWVMSLGGSVIVPDRINVAFLKQFSRLLQRTPGRFVISTGGGKTARDYINAARRFTTEKETVDLTGIAATALNAQLVAATLPDAVVVHNPSVRAKFGRFLVSHGWLAGSSSDYDAVLLSRAYATGTIINITNVPYIYDKDPKKHKNARPLKELTWSQALRILPVWESGAHAPFDPIAGRLAQKLGKEVIVLKSIANLKKCLESKPFEGTRIR